MNSTIKCINCLHCKQKKDKVKCKQGYREETTLGKIELYTPEEFECIEFVNMD